ncbi:MAG: hypothetical protein KJO08_09670 [Gammaproteobacteria bacterium]|nr:hypothetical protein [Gammaproteobacteria bacterium]NNJ83646.1 hypothetical protein [Gammaproteobacteria bacterium]
MGQINTQIHVSNFGDKAKYIDTSALIDTGAAYLTLPATWKERLGNLEKMEDVEIELADGSVKTAELCGPVRLRIHDDTGNPFRKTSTEVLFMDMVSDKNGRYEPLVGFIPLEQAGVVIDPLTQKLFQMKRVKLKNARRK